MEVRRWSFGFRTFMLDSGENSLCKGSTDNGQLKTAVGKDREGSKYHGNIGCRVGYPLRLGRIGIPKTFKSDERKI